MMDTQTKTPWQPWLTLIALVLAGAAWIKFGLWGVAAIALWFAIVYWVVKSSQIAAIALTVIVLPLLILGAAALRETNREIIAPTPPVEAAQPIASQSNGSTISPADSCRAKYAGVNPAIKDADMIASTMCQGLARPGYNNTEFAQCVLDAVETSRSDDSFVATMSNKCNLLYRQ